MNKELKDIYKTHAGKISDKWQIYLEEYEEKFKKYRNGPIGLLEIGIQNGGSLEIYSEYFPNAEKIIGCDIHPNCHLLKYNSKVVSVIVGDANSQNVMQMIQSYGEFDIIIDDGSHTSSDIVNSFCNYFGSLRQGGLYVIEDLHCSYWQGFDGGLFHPLSSINFLKRLVDIINHEHWGLPRGREYLLTNFAANFGARIENLQLEMIHSIEFVNSMCFIKKLSGDANLSGLRVIAGTESLVEAPHPDAYGQIIQSPTQEQNFWANRAFLPEDELAACYREIEGLRAALGASSKR